MEPMVWIKGEFQVFLKPGRKPVQDCGARAFSEEGNNVIRFSGYVRLEPEELCCSGYGGHFFSISKDDATAIFNHNLKIWP